jgi:hypothetical protein
MGYMEWNIKRKCPLNVEQNLEAFNRETGEHPA